MPLKGPRSRGCATTATSASRTKTTGSRSCATTRDLSSETCSIAQGDDHCRVGDAGFYPNSFRDIEGLSTDRLEVGIRCTGSSPCLNGGSLHRAWATIYASRVTIEDDQDPTITNVQGPLVDDGRARGTEEVSFDAKDNAGAKEVALRVDGNDAGRVALPCDYTYARPCDDFNGPLCRSTRLVTRTGRTRSRSAPPTPRATRRAKRAR